MLWSGALLLLLLLLLPPPLLLRVVRHLHHSAQRDVHRRDRPPAVVRVGRGAADS